MTEVVAPTDTVVANALTDIPVTVVSAGSTVISIESVCPSNVAVIVAEPLACTVITPAALILASEGLLDVHVADAVALVPSL